MIVPSAPVPRESYSYAISARLLPRLSFLVLLFAFAAAPFAFAQYPTYPIYTDVSSIPAGSFGATIEASVNDPSRTPNFNVCFDTGYGSSKVPIVPYAYVNLGDFTGFYFNVPAATIQDVPPSAFSAGSFTVSIYSVPTYFTACSGNEAGAPTGNTVTLNYPVLRSASLPFLPEQNVALSGREPSSISLAGSNFISNSGTSGKVPSAVNFISSTTVSGTVKFLSNSALRSTIPTSIPASASSVNIQVCNTATYSYCSNSLTLKTAALQADPGTLTASPSPALTTQPVTLTASFGPPAHSTAGAPSGPVTFGDWGSTLGTANLVLDKTATFARAPTQQFSVYAAPIAPIVADFNGDGVPDTLFIDPGTSTSGSSLHLLLGTVPSGSFKTDKQFYVFSDGPSIAITSAAVGDFNGDGIPDIVLLATEPGYTTNPTLYTMLGNGDGTFQDGLISSPTLYGSQIVAGDFNKDGKQDILIAGALDASGTIGLQALLGDGAGNFKAGPATTGLRTAPSPYFGDFKVATADFNGDGYPDIAVMNGYSPSGELDNSIEVYQNDGKGLFLAPVRVQTDGTPTADFSIAPLGPGLPLDIIFTSTASSIPGIFVALNQSTTAKISFFGTFEGTEVPGFTQAVFGDFDGDGLLDAAVDDGKTIHVLSGDGSGAFTGIYTGLSIVPPGTTLIAASDENGDKYADLLLYTSGALSSGTYPITLYDYITAGTATATFPPVTFAAGTHPLHASTAGTFDILAGTATTTLIVTAPAPSTVTLAASPVSPASYGVAMVTLTATIPVTNATGTVSFYNGSTLLGTGPLAEAASSTATYILSAPPAGTYSFKAVYGGDTLHGGGTSAVLPYVVSPVAATITWKPSPSTIVYGTPLSAAQLDATATGITGAFVAGSFTYAPASGTVLTAGTHSIVATFTPTDTNYSKTTATATITVTAAVPVITWTPSPATIAYGTPLSAAQLDATASTPGSFVYTPALGTVLPPGPQTLQVSFTPADSTDFLPATGTALITVTGATPVITWTPAPATITYGTPLSASQLDATSSVPGTFTYTPALGTILTAGAQTLSAAFTPADTVHYKPVTATATITVTQATPAVAWTPSPATINYGTALSAAQLDASSSTAGTFTYTPALGAVLTAGTQTLSVVFTPTDTVDFKSVTATSTIVVTAVAPVISWTPSPATISYGTALSTAQLDATSPAPGSFNYTPALGTILSVGTQTISLVFTPKDATDFKPVTTTTTIVVTPASPAITWVPTPATITYGTALTAAQLDASSTTAGTFNYTPGLGTILTAGTQTLSAVFNPTDTTDFKSVTATVNIVVTAVPPAITWNPSPTTITYGTPLAAGQLNATSTTPGTFTYTPALGTVLAAGTQTLSVLFTPTDSVDFKSATATATIVVTPATPVVSWTPSPAALTYGTPLSAAQLDASSSTPGTFTYTPALGAVLTVGTQTLTSVFTPTDAADFKSVTSRVTITVTAVMPAITWTPSPSTLAYGTALSAAQLDATSSTPGTFTYTPALGTILTTGIQTLKVAFTPTDATDFTPASATATITVTAATPAVTWTPSPATITYGTALTAAQLDATASTPGNFIYMPALGTILSAGTQTLSVTFTPSDTTDFKQVTATATITVTAATPAVTWTPSPATITYGAALSAAQLDANSSTPGSFTYTPTVGTVLTAGTQTLSATFTPSDTTDFKSVTTTATITVTAATPTVTWNPSPATIPYGTALSAAQLNAAASTTGTFSYNPALGTVLSAGPQVLSALFTPADSKDFKSITTTATITVVQAAPAITWATPASIVDGTALSSTQLDAIATGVTGSPLPGTFTYAPPAGTVLAAGAQTLKVTFTPSDLADYTSAAASVSLQVIPVSLTALSANTAALGDPAKTITLTGTGFVPSASVLVSGNAVPTAFVSQTTLTAVIPASDFLVAQVLEISVAEPSQSQTTASLPFLVGAPPANAVFSGPSTISSGTQTSLTFTLAKPYPVDLAANFTLSFTPATGLPNDPTVVFASGGTTFAAAIPANSTTVPPVMFQSGTVAGTITVALTLDAGGVNVTPASIQPLSIQAPLAAPGITSTALTRSGNTLTVEVHGFSNPRDMKTANFHFTPIPGGSIGDQDVTIDVGSLFTTWYADPASSQYGSGFTYTQVFNLSSAASVVGQVSVTLVNSVGNSLEASTP